MDVRNVLATLFTPEQAARLEAIEQRLQEIQRRARTLEIELRDSPPRVKQRSAIEKEKDALDREVSALTAEGAPLAARKALVDKVSEVLPVAEIAGAALEFLPDLAKEPVHTLVGGFLTVLEDMESESVRFAKLRARGTKNFLEALTTADFTRDEAMQIILASIAGSTATRAAVQAASSAASRK